MLPQKTFLTKQIQLFDSDFECNGQAKPQRIMQLLQNIATEHAEQLGFGWDVMNADGILWVLSKINLIFNTPVTAKNAKFTLYTWPLKPNRFFAERCFAAVDENGKQLFSATSLWMIISRNERRILSAEIMNGYYGGDYSEVHSDAPNAFERVRKDSDFEFCYQKTIRRSDLDKNGHVNNTNYVTFAVDVLPPEQKISAVEIVFDKELKLRDEIQIFSKRVGENVYIVGERNAQTSFSAVLKLSE